MCVVYLYKPCCFVSLLTFRVGDPVWCRPTLSSHWISGELPRSQLPWSYCRRFLLDPIRHREQQDWHGLLWFQQFNFNGRYYRRYAYIIVMYVNFGYSSDDFQFRQLSGLETRFGYMDLKSSPVHFYVQRSTPFTQQNAIIPYNFERLNVGGAMNIKTGVFTAPRNGTYHFAFAFLRDGRIPKFVSIFLRKMGPRLELPRHSP